MASTEKILEMVNNYIDHAKIDRNAIHTFRKAENNRYDIPECDLAMIISALEEDISRKAAKSAGNGNARKAALNIIKNAEKQNRMLLNGIIESDNNTAKYICDGYTIIKFENIAFELPKIEDKPENIQNTYNSMENIFKSNKSDISNYVQIETPDIIELKTKYKVWKAENKRSKEFCLYDFSEDENAPRVNLEYLINTLEIMPNCKIMIHSSNPHKMIYFVDSENGMEAFLCPVRKNKK